MNSKVLSALGEDVCKKQLADKLTLSQPRLVFCHSQSLHVCTYNHDIDVTLLQNVFHKINAVIFNGLAIGYINIIYNNTDLRTWVLIAIIYVVRFASYIPIVAE